MCRRCLAPFLAVGTPVVMHSFLKPLLQRHSLVMQPVRVTLPARVIRF
jgi:hypothetical protein